MLRGFKKRWGQIYKPRFPNAHVFRIWIGFSLQWLCFVPLIIYHQITLLYEVILNVWIFEFFKVSYLFQRALTGIENLDEVKYLEMRVDTSETSLGNFGSLLPNLTQLKLNNSIIFSVRFVCFTQFRSAHCILQANEHITVMWELMPYGVPQLCACSLAYCV